jgi:hypothetical protein
MKPRRRKDGTGSRPGPERSYERASKRWGCVFGTALGCLRGYSIRGTRGLSGG